PANLALMHETGYVICLDVTPAIALQRLTREAEERGMSMSDARPLLAGTDALARLGELYARRQKWYEDADLTLDTNSEAPDRIAQHVVASLAIVGVVAGNDSLPSSRMIATATGACYESVIGWGTIASLAQRLERLNAPLRLSIVTDSIIAPLYQDGVGKT